MRFCNRPYEHIYVMKNGETRCCSWAFKRSLGNVVDSSLEEVWNGEDAKALRESIEDGSFRYCDKLSCPLLSNNSLPDLTAEQFLKETKERLKRHPVEFNLAYDFICNHACPSCRNETFTQSEDYKLRMDKIEDSILPHLKNAKLIMASGNGDPFSSKYMLRLLSKIQPETQNCTIRLETNGALVFNNWKKIKHLEKYKLCVVVTPNSYEPATYEKLSGGFDNLDKTIEGLSLLAKLRKEGKIQELKITMVVQESNFREVPSFIQKSLDNFEPDIIQLRPIMKWFKISKETFSHQNLLDPKHPNHHEFLSIMKSPICNHPRVYHWIGKNYQSQ